MDNPKAIYENVALDTNAALVPFKNLLREYLKECDSEYGRFTQLKGSMYKKFNAFSLSRIDGHILEENPIFIIFKDESERNEQIKIFKVLKNNMFITRYQLICNYSIEYNSVMNVSSENIPMLQLVYKYMKQFLAKKKEDELKMAIDYRDQIKSALSELKFE